MTRTVRSITLAFAVLALGPAALAQPVVEPAADRAVVELGEFQLRGIDVDAELVRMAPEGLLTAVWERVVNWFAPEVLNAPREKAGSQMDPNGVTLSTTAPESLETDAGSSMDPNGHR